MVRFIAVIATLGIAPALHAGEAASYAKDVRPLFNKYCVECHNPKSAKGGLDLGTYKAMLEGSDNGPVLVPGAPEESILTLSIEGKGRSLMPPKTAKLRPTKDEIAKVRAWVKAGAKDDSSAIKVALPDIRPKVKSPAPVRALAYLGDNETLLAARHHELLSLDVRNEANRLVIFKSPEAINAIAVDPRPLIAIAMGRPGTTSTILLTPLGDLRPMPSTPAHADMILDLALSHDGQILATASYDTQVKLWDAGTDKLLHTLKEHSDSVYAVAFSPDSKLLATCAADRAVKVWDVAEGKLLYTLGESTDWLYALAWSGDGKHLAAAGVDKSIRVWPAGSVKKKIEHSVFAHEGPIVKLAYSPDSKTLYSIGQDRILKAWDADKMVERKVYDRLPETPLSLAIRPDNKQIAVGRFDGVVQLFDTATGKSQTISSRGMNEVNPAGPAGTLASFQKDDASKSRKADVPEPKKPPAPEAKKITPAEGQRGQPIRVAIEGAHLDQVSDLATAVPSATAKILSKSPHKLEAELLFPPTTPASVQSIELKSAAGTAKVSFTVDLFTRREETEPNDSPGQAQAIELPASIVGSLHKAGDVDFHQFKAAKGQEIGVHVLTAAVGSKVEPVLQITDRSGRLLAESTQGFLGHRFEEAGAVTLGIRDRDFRGGAGMHYRLHVGPIPVVTALFPLGVRAGSATDVQIDGVFLDTKSAKVEAKPDAAPGSQVAVPITSKLGQPLGKTSIAVGAFAEARNEGAAAASQALVAIPVPGTGNGYLRQHGEIDTWRFQAKKGARLILEVEAARLGSSLDSVLDILDGQGEPVARAVLRCQAKTYVTFRDHDNVTAGIRIEAWDDLGPNDYLFVSGELMKIRAVPGHPDADCNFFQSAAGPRLGFLDTTPTHHSQGSPMYKVSVHPPGMTFPPNGFPLFTIHYRNDDGGQGYGRDSRLFFDPPADGEYRVKISDARGQGGRSYGYRLTIRPPQPSFNVRFDPTSPVVWRNGAIPLSISADRIDGYDGPIHVRFDNVPSGFHVPPTVIEPGLPSTTVALYAERDAKDPVKPGPLKLLGEALIDGHKVVKEATGTAPKISDAADIVTVTKEAEVTIKPGGTVKIAVEIERKKGFTGRVPLDVKGLPHGVHVLDIGLNGILITEGETRRTIALQAERWVAPGAHPIVILAKREGSNAEHAAKAVVLKVVGK